MVALAAAAEEPHQQFVVGTIWFTAVDDGNVAFGVFAGGLVAVLCASVFTLLTLTLGSSERGWYRRD